MITETYVIGPSSMTVSPLAQLPSVEAPFIALLPATDLTSLPTTLDTLVSLARAGCAELVLAGPRADAFQGQVGEVIAQHGADMTLATYADLNDACNAALLGALVRRTGLALCADEPELLETLRGVAQMNGWTKSAAAPAPVPAKAKPAANAMPTAKPKAKAKAKAPAKTKPVAKPNAKAKAAAKKPAAKPKAKAKRR
jgi:hypothetical protein